MYIRLMIHDFLVWGLSVGTAYPSDEVIAVKSIPTITTFLFPQTSFSLTSFLPSPVSLAGDSTSRLDDTLFFIPRAQFSPKGNEERTC